jgi:SAM-dependent methyltransferase
MDAEEMDFADDSFDFVWSWGVIHHSADTRRALKEVHRILRPGGSCAIMVYYKSWWHFYICGFLRGVFQRQFNRHGSLHHVAQRATDGAIARYYTKREWQGITNGLFEINDIKIYGLKSEVVPLPHSRLKQLLEDIVPDGASRFMTNRLGAGSFLLACMRKRLARC